MKPITLFRSVSVPVEQLLETGLESAEGEGTTFTLTLPAAP